MDWRRACVFRVRRGSPLWCRRSPTANAGHRGRSLHAAALAAARGEGELAGRVAAAEEFAHEKAAWSKLKLGVSRMDAEAEQAFAARLRETVAVLCERTLQPLALDQAALARRCETMAAMMGEAAGKLTLHIHPEDEASLDPQMASVLTIKPDPKLERGSLRLAWMDGEISDGPAEWRTAIAAAIGLD